MMGEMKKEWYFFCKKDMRYRTGRRAKRATKKGYWKATGRDREICCLDNPAASSSSSASASARGRRRARRELLIGMRKTLVFYTGRAPRGTKTNWVMHVFRLEGKYKNGNASPKDEWVVCKVFHKNVDGEEDERNAAMETSACGTPIAGSSIPPLDDIEGFINSILNDPMDFNSTSCLPDLITIDDDHDVAAGYSSISYSTVAGATTTTTLPSS